MYTEHVRSPIAATGFRIQLKMEVTRKIVHYVSVKNNSHGCVDKVLLLLSCWKNLIPFSLCEMLDTLMGNLSDCILYSNPKHTMDVKLGR